MSCTVKTAPLPEASYEKILNRDPIELARLLEACRTHGFFYLDLRGRESDQTLQGWRDVLSFMDTYFTQPIDMKMRDNRQSDTHGYEPVGTSTGVRPQSKDLYESLKISRDEMRSHAATITPSVKAEIDLFDDFMSNLESVAMNILSSLSSAMGLRGESRFEACHRPGVESRTTLALFRYPKQDSADEGIGHNKHTDIGTLTVLLSEQWGLQVLSPESNEWQFVEPKPGRAVVNVGDSLRFLAGNALRSCVHRVVPLREIQEEDRYSIAYFLRPDDGVEYMTSSGEVVTARAWHDRKFDVFRESYEQQSRDSILTGGMERGDVLVV